MDRVQISTQNAPAAIGPYSQAVKIGDFIFTSGQIPLDPVSGEIVEGGIADQTRQVLRNLQAVLEAAGSSLERTFKTTVFLKNIDDFAAMNAVYADFFAVEPPARSTVGVARLPRDVLVEIEVVATL